MAVQARHIWQAVLHYRNREKATPRPPRRYTIPTSMFGKSDGILDRTKQDSRGTARDTTAHDRKLHLSRIRWHVQSDKSHTSAMHKAPNLLSGLPRLNRSIPYPCQRLATYCIVSTEGGLSFPHKTHHNRPCNLASLSHLTVFRKQSKIFL